LKFFFYFLAELVKALFRHGGNNTNIHINQAQGKQKNNASTQCKQ